MAQKVYRSVEVGGVGGGDVVVNITGSPFGAGFKFNTTPTSGMTIEKQFSVKIASYAELVLAPAQNKSVIFRTTGTRPDASEALRGALFVVRSASGTADTLEVCLKSAADTYAWHALATG